MVSNAVRPNKEDNETPKTRTTIPVFSDTKERLAGYGIKGTWDGLVNDLLDRYDILEAENKELKARSRR